MLQSIIAGYGRFNAFCQRLDENPKVRKALSRALMLQSICFIWEALAAVPNSAIKGPGKILMMMIDII